MSLPTPVPGLVIRYAYLWLEQHRKGQEEGSKNRPCAVVLATGQADGEYIVTVLPITHSRPKDLNLAIEIPSQTKRRLGLDSERSWVVLSEGNRFIWPGPDLCPAIAGDLASVTYGLLPGRFYDQLRAKFLEILRRRSANLVNRSE